MNIKVLYHSSTGNTEKVAKAIAQALNVTAEQIGEDTAIQGPVDLLLIGDGIYAGKPNKHTVALIDRLTPDVVRRAAAFGTFGGQDAIGMDLTDRLKARSIDIACPPFTCRGKSWWFMNRANPSDEDLANARAFAQKALDAVKEHGKIELTDENR